MISIFNTVHMASARKREKSLMQSIATGKDTEKVENPGNQASFQRADWGARKAKAIADGMAALEVSLGRDRHIAQASYDAAKLIREEFMRISAMASENTGYQPINVPNGPLTRNFVFVARNNSGWTFDIANISSIPGFATAKRIEVTDANVKFTFQNPASELDLTKARSGVFFQAWRPLGKLVSKDQFDFAYNYGDLRQFLDSRGRTSFFVNFGSRPPSNATVELSVKVTAFGSTRVETLQTYRVPSPLISRLRSIHEGMADLLKPLSGAAVGADDNLSSVRANHEKIGEMLEQIEVRGNFTELDLSLINGIIDENLNALTGLGLRQSTVEFERSLLNEFSEQTDAKAKGSIEADLAEKSIELASASRVYRVSREMMMDFVASQDQRKVNLVSMLVR